MYSSDGSTFMYSLIRGQLPDGLAAPPTPARLVSVVQEALQGPFVKLCTVPVRSPYGVH